jgi:hypothetical protein
MSYFALGFLLDREKYMDPGSGAWGGKASGMSLGWFRGELQPGA